MQFALLFLVSTIGFLFLTVIAKKATNDPNVKTTGVAFYAALFATLVCAAFTLWFAFKV